MAERPWRRHPIFWWITTAFTVGGVLVGLERVWWYFEENRQRDILWLAEDTEWNNKQLNQLQAILDELVAVKQQIKASEQRIIEAIDRHEEFVSNEHQRHSEGLSRDHVIFGNAIGRVEGMLIQGDER